MLMLTRYPEPTLCCSATIGGRGADHLKRRGGSQLSSLRARPAGPAIVQIRRTRRFTFHNETWPINRGVPQYSHHRHSRILPPEGECSSSVGAAGVTIALAFIFT